jgi:putative protease
MIKSKKAKKISKPKAKPKTKKAKAVKKTIKAKTTKSVKKEILIGEITHFFDQIDVAAMKLKAPLAVGQTLVFKNAAGEELLKQKITSMQIEHEKVTKAKKGAEIGIKVAGKLHENNKAYLA